MGYFRFHRSIRLLPGLRLNISKRGGSVSVGGRGATVNLNKKGVRTTVGLPGSGLSYVSQRNWREASRPSKREGYIGILLLVFCMIAIVYLLG